MKLKLSKESTYIVVDENNKPMYKDGFVCTFKTANDAKKVVDWNKMANRWKIVAVKTVEEVIQPSGTEEIAKLRADIAKLRKDNQVLQEIVNKFFYSI